MYIHKSFILFLLGLIVFSAVFSANTDTNTDTDTDTDVESDNERSGLGRVRYFQATKDLRKCAFPQCGGYFLKMVNIGGQQNDIYVSSIEGAKIDDGSLNEFILSGRLSNGPSFTRTLYIQDTYRLLPLDSPSTLEIKRYFIYRNNVAYELNTGRNYRVNYYVENYSNQINNINEEWLDYKINGHSVIYGNVRNGILDIDRIFIQLPDPQYCPDFPVAQCSPGYIATYRVDNTRCILPTGCARQGICTLSIPTCPNGYTLMSVNSKPNGCPKYYCDPSFLLIFT
ncbi:hypothetical protein CYY_004167 [Polysphondylium violaceum]|uniref:DUF6748 domain-containing protein n=1 Tax=Polysphondylium violaceum TaxID=133409 RepID=A0A8J4PWM5_9MYCE|nr:hypothetical protein CYY_004167 [Polysphondylium violaceum]